MDFTTIQVSKKTRDRLKEIGMKGETYDNIIARLIEFGKKTRFFDEHDTTAENDEFKPFDQL